MGERSVLTCSRWPGAGPFRLASGTATVCSMRCQYPVKCGLTSTDV